MRDAAYPNRRDFMKAVFALLPLGVQKSNITENFNPSPNLQSEKIGLHLGSVQQQLAEDPMKTIGLIDQLGIRSLELQDVALLNRLHPVLTGAGFTIPSSFFPSPYVSGNWNPMAAMGMKIPSNRDFEYVVDQAAQYSLSYLVMPGIFPQDRGGLDDYRQLAEKLNQAGELCQQAGVQLCYHHQSYELQPMENTSPMDVMIETWEAELVKVQVNTFWLSLARIDILDFLKKNVAYLGPMHLEDMAADAPQTYRAITLPPGAHRPLGDGIINFSAIFETEIAQSLPHYFIHLEDMDDPLGGLRLSVSYLDKLLG